jgi:2,3-bisphosphoglycerate-dependent phosphoglycerate mutase
MESVIYLVRHCKAVGQEPNSLLTPEGLSQAVLLCEHFAGLLIEKIVSSPFARARHSIEPLAKDLSIPVIIDERLAERTLSTAPLDDWRQSLRDSFGDLTLRFPGGESSRDAMARGRAAIEAARQGASNAVVVTHGNLLTLILRSFDARFGFDDWDRLTNPDVFCIGADGRVTRVWSDGDPTAS